MKKDRFIPLRKADLINACLQQGQLNEQDKNAFIDLCHILVSTLHFEYHQTLEILKDSYAPFDPNSDTLPVHSTTKQSLDNKQQVFAQTFAQVLNAANFEKVTEQDLQEALHEASLFKVRLEVEFEDFAEVVFYRRGEYQKTETLRKFWGLKKQQVSFTNYDKVAVYIKFKNADYFASKKMKPLNFEPNSTIIKLFQNVPKADLEMLFPNSEVRMRTLDKAIIGGSALVGGTVVLVTKLGASLLLMAGLISYWIGLSDKAVTIGTQELVALCAGAGVIGGFIFKEWSKFKNRKLKFMKALADNLYFKNLDNNAGVFHHLIDAAEEEECKEAILAYYFLLINTQAISSEQLDQQIEHWFAQQFDFEIDFEIEDALNKLHRFGLIEKYNNLYKAVSLNQAHSQLDKQWDSIFS
ncbi:TMEM143 family protein [Aliiglaciecola sp. 3_MG-2023]|uniref:TMEM143 family protein n=1 Tax=Aliiglaciecola sp. 3_MG-2023 TaxID=3062644 RepID=UPI0026E4625E|nr:TMEM143 family protein [Aliiglaciecola sp. 3_MG-2023]MDO6694481.1 TMEM143 family protein [Aliiglaciecola sp. 3_MG-2023]